MRLFTQYKGLKKENYILFLGRIATNLGAMIWPVLTMILNRKLGMSATETATFSIISGLFFLPANLWGGHLADKFNKKRLIICCDIISIILYITSGFMPLSIFSICVVMAGSFFQTLEHPAYNAMVADITPLDKREKAFSLLYLGKNIGLVLAPTIAGFLFNSHLRLCFIINGIAIGISTVLIGFFVKDRETVHKTEHSDTLGKKADDENIMSVIKRSAALSLFIVAMCFQEGAYSQFGYLMPLDISKAYPESGAAIYGSVVSINCFIVVLCTPVITMLLEKISLAKKYMIGTVFEALSFVSFLLSFGMIVGYYVSIILFTLGEILMATVVGSYLASKVPAKLRGRLYGITDFVSAFITGVVKYYSGYLFDNYGLKHAWSFSIAMVSVAVIAAILVVRVDRDEEFEYEEKLSKAS